MSVLYGYPDVWGKLGVGVGVGRRDEEMGEAEYMSSNVKTSSNLIHILV